MLSQDTREEHDQELEAHAGAVLIRGSGGGAGSTNLPEKSQRIAEAPAVLGLLLFAASSACDRGVYNPEVTQETVGQTICVPGYAKAVRPPTNFTNRVKQVLLKRADREPAEVSKYKLDYIVPLALGGHPRKLENFALTLRDGASGARRKNRIEAKLQCLVCSDQVTLADAQREISTDWQAAHDRYAPVTCDRQTAMDDKSPARRASPG